MANNTYILKDCLRFLDFPLHIQSAARRSANRFRHRNTCIQGIYLCFVLAEEKDEILEIDGVPRLDCNPPFMKVAYPGAKVIHLQAGSRNELFFTYDSADVEIFKKFGFHNCNFALTERFSSLLAEIEKLLPNYYSMGIADQLDRLAVMLGMEAMLSSLLDVKKQEKSGTERIYQIRKFFQFHYTENFELKKILSDWGIGRRTFYREWSQAFSDSPAEYLLNLRMNEARMLLQNNLLRIYEIAAECGYPNETYFSRCFARKIGITPQAYRNLYRKHQGKGENPQAEIADGI